MLVSPKQRFIELAAFLLIILFVYTGVDKLWHRQKFEAVLSRMDLVGPFSSLVSWLIPAAELAIAVLLIVPDRRTIGFLSSFILMLLFTLFVGYMLFTVSDLPCSCGGVISGMGWQQHLIFNTVVTVIAGTAWRLRTTKDFIAINRASRKPA